MNVTSEAARSAEGIAPLMSALDSVSDALLVFDRADRLAFWNARWRELLPGFEDGLQSGQAALAVLSRLDAYDGLPLQRDWRVTAAGRTLVCRLPAAPPAAAVSTADAPAPVLAAIPVPAATQDSLSALDQRWRDMMDSVADWLWESNAAGEVTFASDGLCRTIACNPYDAACARRILGEVDWVRQVPAAAERRPFRDVQVSLTTGGERRVFSLSGKPFFGPDGSFAGYRGTGRDVSSRAALDHERDHSRQRLLDAIEHLSHGLAVFDADDRMVLCNERFRRFIPQVADSVRPGAAFADLVRAAALQWNSDAEVVEQMVAEQIECHRLGLTHERRAPDGRWFLVKDMRLTDGSTVTTRTDITELKRREQAVRDSEARFRAIFHHAAIGMAVIQSGGRITQANRALSAMLGYDIRDLQRMRYEDLVHSDYLPEEAKLARRLLGGQIDSYQQEARYLHKDGRSVWGRLTASMVRGDGTEKFAIVMIEDIDERKRAEADLSTFRAVVEASAEAVAILTPEGRPFYINSAHAQLFGRGLAEATQCNHLDQYTEDARAVVEQEVVPALLRGEDWEGVVEARARDGRVFPLWQRAGVVRDQTGRPEFFFAFMHDHTSQQQVQDELTKAKETAEQANVAKTRFLAAASHDLRQPLQALSMFVAVLANRDHAPEDAVLIRRIEDSVNAVETLLNGLLDVSKLEAGLVVPSVTTFSIAPVLDRLAAEFEPLVAEQNLELRMVGSHVMVKSDPALLERILRNLLNNAVRYTKKGRILFGCRRRGDALRIEVWDTGIGIPPTQIKLIFREFHQLGNPGRDRRQGLGLGLAIVERLAQLLDHPIDVASVPDRGSVFSVSVPLANAPQTLAHPKQLSLGIGRRDAAVVVIEDEPDVLESTKLLLESWGYQVFPALDCDAALRLLPQIGKVPDIILADYRLQHGATGGQAISRIRSRLRRSVPAIILTGDTAPERLRQAQASGHSLLHKPVQPAALRQMLDELLTAATGTAAHG